MGFKKQQVGTQYRLVSLARLRSKDLPEGMRRVKEEIGRSKTVRQKDIKVFVGR